MSKYLSNYESAGILRLLDEKAPSPLEPPDQEKACSLLLHIRPRAPDFKPILKRWVGQSMILCILQSPRWRIHDLRLKRGQESLCGVITTSSETSLKLFTAFHIWITFCLLDRFENISNNGMANWPTCGPEDVYLVMLSYQCLRVRTLWKWMFICSV